jgi:RNA polymerase sigma-70 factor (ECF subfamily)
VTSAVAERFTADGHSCPDLRETVERARTGDVDAWEALYRALYPRLLAFARRQLDADRAAEAVSETMARAVAGIDRFSWRDAGFEGWMFAILRHVIVDTHRRAGRDSALAVPIEVPGGACEDGLLADEEAAAVRAAFDRLRADEQELLYLRVVEGLSADDVGVVIGKRAGAVRMGQARALRRLRVILEGDNP